MSRQKLSSNFRVRFEALESRDLMAADLAVTFSSSALLASSSHYDDTAIYETVGAFVGKIPTSTARTVSGGSAVKAPVSVAVSPTPVAQPDWLTLNVTDLALRNLVRQDTATDHVLSRSDMLGVFKQVEVDGKVSSNEFADLKKIVGNTSYFAGLDYVKVLTTDVVNGNTANAHFQGSTLGNLAANSSASQLDKLVGKWFLGQDHPTTPVGWNLTYQQAAGSLFPHAPLYTDVHQGAVGDCYFVGSLAETALANPALIKNMFIVNGDGTYTVRFYHDNTAEYVTVDSKLPVDSRGNYVFANDGQNIHNASTTLWVALAEKAYAQMNESGWLRADVGDAGHNSYDAISGGYMFDALHQSTGKATGYYAVDKNTFTTLFNGGQMITFGSMTNPVDHTVVGNHAYAVVSYNKTTQQVTLFNPWGINNGYMPGLVTLSWTQMKNDFSSMQYTV